MTKPNHGGHRKLQHLLGGAAPNTTQHGQEVPLLKRQAKAVLLQKLSQGLHELVLLALFRQGSGQLVKTHDLSKHADELPIEQVRPLCKHRVQAGAIPLQVASRSQRRSH